MNMVFSPGAILQTDDPNRCFFLISDLSNNHRMGIVWCDRADECYSAHHIHCLDACVLVVESAHIDNDYPVHQTLMVLIGGKIATIAEYYFPLLRSDLILMIQK